MALLLKEQPHEVLEDIFTVDSLVYVTCYGPFWGFRGTVCAVDVIPLGDTQEALYFYLVALQEGQMKEPLWLVQDDIAAVEGENPDETRLRMGGERGTLAKHSRVAPSVVLG